MHMPKKIIHLLLILGTAALLLPLCSAVGQTTNSTSAPVAGPGVVDPGHSGVNEVDNRLENQKDRIQQGVNNGTLDSQQAHRLARNDQRIANQEKRDMAANGGHLTRGEQKQLNRELNHNNRKIYREKH